MDVDLWLLLLLLVCRLVWVDQSEPPTHSVAGRAHRCYSLLGLHVNGARRAVAPWDILYYILYSRSRFRYAVVLSQ